MILRQSSPRPGSVQAGRAEQVGIIGLGRMGNAITFRLLQAGHAVIGFDPNEQARKDAQELGAQITDDITVLPQKSKVIWIMVPAGEIIDDVLNQLKPNLKPGFIIIDGGNSYFKDAIRRAEELNTIGVHFLDCGTSGGLLARDIGFSLMIGGEKKSYEQAEPIFKAIAAPHGYGYMGLSGSGHYVKMIHNGIEYALLEAYAEGFMLLKDGYYKDLDLEKIADVWCHGAVIRSWILELAHNVFMEDQNFNNISGKIGGGQTGRWTVEQAQKQKIPVPLIEQALAVRQWSQKTGGNWATKLVALLRNQFGGHPVEKLKEDKS